MARGGKRQQTASSSSSRRDPPTAAATASAKRASRLARENGVSAAEETDIREAFRLFAVRDEAFARGRADVIPVGDVRRALIALSLPPSSSNELRSITASIDPTGMGLVDYPSFLAVCALKLRARTPKAVEEAIDAAFRLFTNGRHNNRNKNDDDDDDDDGGPITIAHLRRVARELKEDVSDQVLRDMILEANGGSSVARGVKRDEFEAVMRRAGAF